MSSENDGEENERDRCTVGGNIADDGDEIDKVKRPNAILLYHHMIELKWIKWNEMIELMIERLSLKQYLPKDEDYKHVFVWF